MARTNKTGICYFPLDVDFFQDEKIQFVSARFGLKGEVIALRLLCKIYRNGYYTEWTDDTALLFAKSVGDGCQDSLVKDVVSELLKRGFFDRGVFERFSILTSRGIQSRYFEATRRYKRVEVVGDFLLLDVSRMDNVDINPINVNISANNDGINPQKKREGNAKEIERENSEDFCEVFDELGFENAWELYGRKGNKKTCAKKWANLKERCREAALGHIPKYVAATPDVQYRKNFETYINQEVWNDEIILKNGTNQRNGKTSGQRTTDEEFIAAMQSGFARAEYDKARRERGNVD